MRSVVAAIIIIIVVVVSVNVISFSDGGEK